jgi:hypothetical protein
VAENHDSNEFTGAWDDADAEYDDGDGEYCYRCNNEGTIFVCPDDMCRGCGECIHGDGEIICPDCKGRNAL